MAGIYAVRKGRNVGIYHSWKECEAQVKGFSKAQYKKFRNPIEAQAFIDGEDDSSCTLNHYTTSEKSIKRCKRSHDSDTCYSDENYESVVKRYKKSDCSSPTPVVYSDGACHANGYRGAHGGIGVYWGDLHPCNVSEKLTGAQTNQRAELVAACRALETAIQQGYKSIELRTDSTYTIRTVTDWIKKWRGNGWKTAKGESVKNKEDIVRLDDLCSKINVKWACPHYRHIDVLCKQGTLMHVKVPIECGQDQEHQCAFKVQVWTGFRSCVIGTHIKGHSGVPGNEAADELAKAGSLL